MKDFLQELVQKNPDPGAGRNLMREYLQVRILSVFQQRGAMTQLAFCGGTALRLLYDLPRYSEDLDFCLHGDSQGYDFNTMIQAVRNELGAEGYDIELKVSDQKTVHSAFVRFAGLLRELGLSPHRAQVFSVKIEVDTRPPAGAATEVSLVRRHLTVRLQHHDRASLLAGKLHAILQRQYVKGRDLHDLLWYLADRNWPAPNLVLLNNALAQTGWPNGEITGNNWRGVVAQRIRQMDFARVLEDVAPFLAPNAGADLLTRDNLLSLLGEIPK